MNVGQTWDYRVFQKDLAAFGKQVFAAIFLIYLVQIKCVCIDKDKQGFCWLDVFPIKNTREIYYLANH